MPRRTWSETDIKRIAEKYVRSVSRDMNKVPNIHNIIRESFANVAPDRKIEDADIAGVISNLSKRSIVNDKAILEATKQVVDHSAMEDLKHMINRNIQQMGKRGTPKDVDAIIKSGKLDPHSSPLQTIRNAVRDYFTKGKPLESMSPVEVRNAIKSEIDKFGDSDESDVRSVVNQYLNDADQDKPFDPDMVQSIIKAHIEKKAGGPSVGPAATQISRGKTVETPGPKPQKIKPGEWVPPIDPKNLTFFEKIRIKMRRYGIKSLSRGARNWLTDTVNKVARSPSRSKLIKEGQTVADALVGSMFMYFYDAKHKKTLPYWDKFPLVFIIDLTPDGWYGLNLHYLPLPIRTKLFDKLLQFADDKSLDKITKLRLSYNLIKSVSQYPEVRPTIKRYLSSQVRSDMVKIQPVDWEIALFLPVEQFQKETKQTVWKKSREKIQKLRRTRP